MSTSNGIITSITGILTIGVGGMVGWAKKNITALLKEAQTIRDQSTKDLDALLAYATKIEDDVTKISSEISAILPKPKPASKVRSTAKKSASRTER